MIWRKIAHLAWWIGLSAFFGGILTLAITASSISHTARDSKLVLPGIASPPLEMGPEVTGELFGNILRSFAHLEVIALGLMLVGLVGLVAGHRHIRHSTWVLMILWIGLAGLVTLDLGYVTPAVWNARDDLRTSAAARPKEAKDAPWPDREKFDRLHGWAEEIGKIELFILTAMIIASSWRSLTEPHARART